MARSTLGTGALPDAVAVALMKLGGDIRIARQRRQMSQEDMAGSMFVTPKTLRRAEAGEPGVGLGIYACALFVLGMADRLAGVAAPETDEFANWRDRLAAPKRVRKKKGTDRLDF